MCYIRFMLECSWAPKLNVQHKEATSYLLCLSIPPAFPGTNSIYPNCCGGALEPSVVGVATYRSLISWQGILNHPLYAEPASSFVPRAVVHYDLRELAKSLRPRPYLGVEPYDSMRQVLALVRGAGASEILRGLQL